jgi:hypothetical protein
MSLFTSTTGIARRGYGGKRFAVFHPTPEAKTPAKMAGAG